MRGKELFPSATTDLTQTTMKRTKNFSLVAIFFLFTSSPAFSAIPPLPHGAPEPPNPELPVKTAPIETIISDLTKLIETNPDSPDTHSQHLLAQAHAFAYSQKLLDSDRVPVRRGKHGIWFVGNKMMLPFGEVKETEDKNRQLTANAHLAMALATYKNIVSAQPDCDIDVKVSYAWCLNESGKLKEAKTIYREAAEVTWKKEYRRLAHGDKSNFVEIAEQLMPLLDGDELAELKTRHKKISTEPRPVRCPGPIPEPPRVPMPKPDIVEPGPNIPVPNAEFRK